MWQIIMPDVELRKVGLLVVDIIIDVVFVVAEVDKVDGVAWHSPAKIATHTIAHGNDGADKDEVELVEVPCPRNFSLRRWASSSGMMQRAPAAVSRISMQSVGVVPTYSQAENDKEKDGHDDDVAFPKSVALSQGVIAWCRGTSRLHGRGKKRGGQSA